MLKFAYLISAGKKYDIMFPDTITKHKNDRVNKGLDKARLLVLVIYILT
jgi:hypothetical protein